MNAKPMSESAGRLTAHVVRVRSNGILNLKLLLQLLLLLVLLRQLLLLLVLLLQLLLFRLRRLLRQLLQLLLWLLFRLLRLLLGLLLQLWLLFRLLRLLLQLLLQLLQQEKFQSSLGVPLLRSHQSPQSCAPRIRLQVWPLAATLLQHLHACDAVVQVPKQKPKRLVKPPEPRHDSWETSPLPGLMSHGPMPGRGTPTIKPWLGWFG
jgi:hypothetical protein